MSRRIAREKAMQVLFQVGLINANAADALEATLDTLQDLELADSCKNYTNRLVQGTIANLAEVDQLIKEKALKWHIDRIGNVEKAVLRLAVYELLYEKDVPKAVVINEAIELVKVFGSEKGASFVNAILDKIA